MSSLDRLLPAPRLREVDRADVAAPPAIVWEIVRHGDLGRSSFARALFRLRTLPDRLAGREGTPGLRLDDLTSSNERPGFRIFTDEPPREVTVGAIGKVWKLDIPFVHVATPAAFSSFGDPGFIKVAWAVRVLPLGSRDSRIEIEVRVDATDDDAWRKFRRYFRLIGPGSHFIRRSALAALVRELGSPEALENVRPLAGDELLPDATVQLTDAVDIAASPEGVWPWLVQMGCGRAGYYSIDILDNGGARSARELHPELATLALGDVLPASPGAKSGFEVLRLEAPRTLVLGGLYDAVDGNQLQFASPRPARFFQVTWVFVLEPRDEESSRLRVRVRAALSADGRRRAIWSKAAHRLLEAVQLRNLAMRAEGRLPASDWRDVLSGLGGVAHMVLAFLTPFRVGARSHWGLDAATAARALPGDELVPDPRWCWTHGVEIEAGAEQVWRWISQIGADRGGFYSYQWLENLAGCRLRNAERIHPEWEVRDGDELLLHPRMPRMAVVHVERPMCFVAFGAPDPAARAAGSPWTAASWLFLVEPLGEGRCRLLSRLRCSSSTDLPTRVANSPILLEPVGYAMDRRMLLGVKERAEAA